MRMNEISYDNSAPVDGYGAGFFRIGGKRYDGAVVASASGVQAWGGYVDTETLTALADALDVLFVGTGAEIAHLPAEFRTLLEQAGIGVESMASPAACRTYNVLLSEGRRVAVALIPV
ncbi:Uncharacterized conserved protein, contains Mth938-like domain [Yoonia tamlensis]|uniref:Uncharacterized conserved protein, contains Mth938-like domain n=1 Tax=Yoonia tamlensis TaxID=390270 RepID=A0A1I6GI85_9RHOB|nr:Mth938-like domain-containing protein [Yoonia tamlensis]SFR41933.1 Uncharacterized conserved protein, contains Mth938-like domain [Yoonia tamlensis]